MTTPDLVVRGERLNVFDDPVEELALVDRVATEIFEHFGELLVA
jgi:hypothetical protein